MARMSWVAALRMAPLSRGGAGAFIQSLYYLDSRETMYAAGPRMHTLPTKPASMLSPSNSQPQASHHRYKTGSHMQITSEMLTLIGTLGGVLIGAIATTVTTYITKRSEERRHFQQLAMQAAIESWKGVIQHDRAGRVAPLSHFILHTVLTSQLLSQKGLTPEIVRKRHDEISAMLATLEENADASRRR